MSTTDPRFIDAQLLSLPSGLFDTLPPPPPRSARDYPGRDVDYEVLDLNGGLFDLPPGPSLRDSLSPTVDSEAPADPLPPIPVRRYGVAQALGTSLAVALMALSLVMRPGAHPVAAAAPALEPTVVVPMRIVAERAPAPVAIAPAPAVPRKAVVKAIAVVTKAPAPTTQAAVVTVKTPDDLAIAAPAALPPARDIDMAAASRAVSAAARAAGACFEADDARTTMPVSITFAPSGRVTSAKITGGPLVGTEIGGCVARSLRGAAVAPFAGDPVTVSTTVHVR